MTKRFEVVMNEFDEVEYIMDKVAMEDRDFAEFIDFVEDICNENEQLKQHILEVEEDNERLEQITSQFKMGDIVNLKYANELIDEQRKKIRILNDENEQLKKRLMICQDKVEGLMK